MSSSLIHFLMCSLFLFIFITASYSIGIANSERYEPNWESLDSRPLPKWYDKAKIGIFIHWGVFSVPSFSSEWFWYHWKSEQNNGPITKFMNDNYKPNFTYQDFARDFTAEFYDPEHWAALFQKSGAKYVVLTTKHHEGFTLWPSNTSYSWNAVDVGPNRDLVAPLAQAVRKQNLRFGVYHSLFEWFNPLWIQDKENNFSTRNFVNTKAMPELYDLVHRYEPDIVWSDGEAEAEDVYWGSMEFLAWLYNDSPVKEKVVVNDRWGASTTCKHGDFYNCDDRFAPSVLQPHKWENAFTLDARSWGFRRNAQLKDYLSIEEVLELLIRTVACGGNVLINVGPTKEGTISAIFEERLLQLGSWLQLNGEAIYDTVPWTAQNDTLNEHVWYTQKEDSVYGLILRWPENEVLAVGSLRLGPKSVIQLLSYPNNLSFATMSNNVTLISFPKRDLVKSNWAYVIKVSYLQ